MDEGKNVREKKKRKIKVQTPIIHVIIVPTVSKNVISKLKSRP